MAIDHAGDSCCAHERTPRCVFNLVLELVDSSGCANCMLGVLHQVGSGY